MLLVACRHALRAGGALTCRSLRTAVLGSLIPWAAFIVVVAVDAAPAINLPAAAAIYLVFVALPSAVPVAATRSRSALLAALVVMTAVSPFATIGMTTSDDAQARLAVLLVPYVALPLGTAIWVAQAVPQRRAAAPQLDMVNQLNLQHRKSGWLPWSSTRRLSAPRSFFHSPP